MLRTMIAMFAVGLALACAGGAAAADRDGGRGWDGNSRGERSRGVGPSIPCAGSRLVIEETDAESGAAVRVRLGAISAERSGNVVTVRRGGEAVLSFELSADAQPPAGILDRVNAAKTLTDLCLMDDRDREIFTRLAAVTLLPSLGAPNALTATYAGGFVLMGVLFILLVIIGAG